MIIDCSHFVFVSYELRLKKQLSSDRLYSSASSV